MTYRKKRLLTIQIVLISAAILLMYLFYYQGNRSDTSVNLNTKLQVSQDESSSSNFFEDVEYRGIDANGNRYLLQSKIATFDKDVPELIDMGGMKATFYFKGGKILKIFGDKGIYNNKTNDMKFRENVEVTQGINIIRADNLDYFNLEKKINVYGNVEGKSLDGNFTADNLILNVEDQTVDFSMNNDGQVKVNLKR
tara:strand:+ start:698 stop:1285 length:588 start_codon:yes stop_codon:yes gene_type:complete